MPRKPTISPTKISLYLACPVRYRWTYVDSRGRWYLGAKSYYSFGLSLHKALERFHSEGETGVASIQEVLAAYDEGWVDAGFRSAEEMAEAFGEGRAILERHVEDSLAAPPGVRTRMVERELRHDMGEFILLGRLDRLDEHPDGTLEIVDYKSGRHTVREEHVRDDIAMGVYQLLVKRRYPDRPVRARILALRSGESAVCSMSDEEMAEFEQAVLQVGREILCEDFYERRPVPKPLCNGCDFLPLCEKDPAYS